jgi:hypothetical protein
MVGAVIVVSDEGLRRFCRGSGRLGARLYTPPSSGVVTQIHA